MKIVQNKNFGLIYGGNSLWLHFGIWVCFLLKDLVPGLDQMQIGVLVALSKNFKNFGIKTENLCWEDSALETAKMFHDHCDSLWKPVKALAVTSESLQYSKNFFQ